MAIGQIGKASKDRYRKYHVGFILCLDTIRGIPGYSIVCNTSALHNSISYSSISIALHISNYNVVFQTFVHVHPIMHEII